MPLISTNDMNHFENHIYLPMVLTILLKDRQLIESGDFKLKGPYLQLVDQAVKQVEKEMRETKEYMNKRGLKMRKGQQDNFGTQYIFFHDGYEEKRTYMNLRLRNRTEELLRVYLEIAK